MGFFLVVWLGFSVTGATIIYILNLPSYSNFERYRNNELFKNNIPKSYNNHREIYSEDRYIYKINGSYDSRCVYAYITNRDDRPEIVIDWIVISPKKYCKEVGNWVL